MMKNGKRYLLVAIALLLATVMFSGLAMAADEEAPKPIKEIKFVDEKTDYEVELKSRPTGYSQPVAYTIDVAATETDQYVEWTSDDEDVATISQARLTGNNTVIVNSVKPGKVTVTGVVKDKANKPTGVKATFTVNFKEVAAESLNFNTYSERITLMDEDEWEVDEKNTGYLVNLLKPQILPTTATYSSMRYEELTWTSSDPSILLVHENGWFTALKLGKVTVTATTTLGSKKLTNTAEIEIYQDPIKSATFIPDKFEVEPSDDPFYVGSFLKCDPEYTAYKKISFKSSDPEIYDGYNIGKKAGTVTITAEILNYDGTKVTATCTVTVKPVALKALSFTKSSITLKPNNQDGIDLKEYLKKDPLDVDLRYDDLCWESSNPQVVEVSDGEIWATAATGSATISVYYKDNPAIEASIEVTVSSTAINNVRFDRKALTLYYVAKPESKKDIATEEYVNFTIEPKDAAYKYITVETSNAKVAVAEWGYSEYGGTYAKVTAVGKGKCKITVYVNDGKTNYTAQLKVTVTDKGPSAKLNYKNLTLKVGKKEKLVAKDTNKLTLSGKWSSSDKSIAKVNKKGVVKGVNPGRCVITFTPKSKSIRPISCQVKVVKPAN